jgi:multiple sugar transport system ATP-binding protein
MPVSRFVAGFLGSPPMNFLPVKLEHGRIDLLNGKTTGSSGDWSGQAELGIRPEKITVTSEPSGGLIEGAVSLIEPLGADTLLTVERPDMKVIVRVVGDSALALGAQVGLRWHEEDHHLFDSSTGQRMS